MIPKNRKFNVAGVSYHQASVNVGDEIHFELEPSNPYDSNAVKVLKRNGTVLGHVPKEMSEEVTKFLTGKYPNYSAYVYEIWEMRDGAKHFDVPKIMAHFANQPNELPSMGQERAITTLKARNKTVDEMPFEYEYFVKFGRFVGDFLTNHKLITIIGAIIIGYFFTKK